MPTLGIVAGLGLALSTAAPARVEGSGAKAVTVVPGAHYQASGFRRLFLGSHWRDAWNTPIEVPVVDLDTFDGGLTPGRQGGGLETLNLHFKSGAGRTWVFRSMDKNVKRNMDPDTAEGVLGDLTQDMVSGAHPCAPLVVAPLSDAVGVLHPTPVLVVLPDDPRLGEFRAQFGGMLGAIELRVEHEIPGVDKVEDTLSLLERLDRRSDERVDARGYLRARLVDILVGDWDRHIDQFRWVRIDRVWHVVARDHDEAFARFDGALPSIIEYYGKQPTGWGDTFPPIDKLTFAGRYTDRRFLVPLGREEWEAVTAQVVARLTDTVLADAVRKLPPPMYAKDGERLLQALRSRRDRLPEESREYYRLLAREVDIRATTASEEFEVQRRPGGSVTVAVFATDEQGGSRNATPRFQRTFEPDETSEIRLYTMGGHDRVVEQGIGTDAILLRVVAPPGTSEVDDRSPQASATKIDAPPEPVPLPPEELARKKERDPRVEERLRYEVSRDWGSDLLFFPQLSYDGTRGLFLGAYAQRTGFAFGLDPEASLQKFGAAWATRLGQPRIEYGAAFRTRSPLRVLVYAAYSGIEQAKYFGAGNETPRDSHLLSSGFYDANQKQVVVNPMVEVGLVGALRARVGAEFKHVSSVDQAGLIAQQRPSGATGMSVGSAQAGLVFAESSGTYPRHRVLSADVVATVSPDIFNNPATFGKVRGSVSGAYGTHLLTNLELSGRLSGERNFGTYPFFESAFVGGTPGRSPLDVTGASSGNLLRGYDLNRFAGDAAVAANTELTVEVGKYNAFLPLRYGVFGLYDVGRVFVDGESSSKWHTGAGGGLWLGLLSWSPYFQLAGSIKAAIVKSDEGTSFYLSSGLVL